MGVMCPVYSITTHFVIVPTAVFTVEERGVRTASLCSRHTPPNSAYGVTVHALDNSVMKEFLHVTGFTLPSPNPLNQHAPNPLQSPERIELTHGAIEESSWYRLLTPFDRIGIPADWLVQRCQVSKLHVHKITHVHAGRHQRVEGVCLPLSLTASSKLPCLRGMSIVWRQNPHRPWV